jgi:hypothetical protein
MGRLDGDYHVTGTLSMGRLAAPAASITNTMIAPGASGSYILSTKVQQQWQKTYAQPNTTATTETRVVHVVYGAAGTILGFRAGSIVANLTTATVTVDLKKNGVSVLTAVITLDNANTARVAEAGTLSTTALVAGDVLEVVITATAAGGTLATGVFCQVELTEDPQ